MENVKTSYKLLSIDLDGTLLSGATKIATKKDCVAIQEFMSLNGLALINTGRPPWAIYNTITRINKFGKNRVRFMSCLNGSYVMDLIDNQVITKNISHEYCHKILSLVKKSKGIYACFHTARGIKNHTVELSTNNPLIKWFYPRAKAIKIIDEKDLTSLKINVFSLSEKKLQSFYQMLLSNNFQQIVNVSCTHKNMLEITPKCANKGESIKLIAQKYNIIKNEIASIGDSFNDQTAFEQSALTIGIAPKDKNFARLCNEIIDHKKNGVADAIYKYIIKKDLALNNIKIIFMDLDGTLIDAKTKLYSQDTAIALQQCTNVLIPLVIASGRSIFDSIEIINEMKLNPKTNVYVVGNNGATIYDIFTHQYIKETPVEETRAKQVFDYIVNLEHTTEKGNVGIIMHTRSNQLIFYNEPFFKPLNFKKTGREDRYDPWVKPVPRYVTEYPVGEICYKFIIKFSTAEKASYYNQYLKSQFPDLEICLSSPVNIEVNHKGVTKAYSANIIAKKNNINLNEMLVMGDGQNDIAALEITEHSFVPCYARDDVKQASKHVIENVDASTFAAKVINQYVLVGSKQKRK